MSEDTIQPTTADLAECTSEEIDAELLAEYQREIDRHEEAVRMVKLKEQEANEAKRRSFLENAIQWQRLLLLVTGRTRRTT